MHTGKGADHIGPEEFRILLAEVALARVTADVFEFPTDRIQAFFSQFLVKGVLSES